MVFSWRLVHYLRARRKKRGLKGFCTGEWLESLGDEDFQRLRRAVNRVISLGSPPPSQPPEEAPDMMGLVIRLLNAEGIFASRIEEEALMSGITTYAPVFAVLCSLEEFRRRGWIEISGRLSLRPGSFTSTLTEKGQRVDLSFH
jgi:hypothetical protein